MNNYQIREKLYTEALASARVGSSLANSIIRKVPSMISQNAIFVKNTEKSKDVKSGYNNFDFAYFQMLASQRESRNLEYMKKKVDMYYSNKRR